MWVRDFLGRFGFVAFEKWFTNREPLFRSLYIQVLHLSIVHYVNPLLFFLILRPLFPHHREAGRNWQLLSLVKMLKV